MGGPKEEGSHQHLDAKEASSWGNHSTTSSELLPRIGAGRHAKVVLRSVGRHPAR